LARNGKKSGGRDFKPGNPGGPGKPPLPPELKEAKRLTKTAFEAMANRFLWMTTAELAAHHDDPATPAIERLIISILAAGETEGDQARAEWFLNRLLGKVTDKVEVSQPKPFVIQRSDGSETLLGAAPPKDEE
jgi:hypothetical protein